MSSDPTPTDPVERAATERAERERVVRGLASAMQGPAYGTATLNKAERALDYLSAAGLLAATAAQLDEPIDVPRGELVSCIRGITAMDIETKESFERADRLASDIADAIADAGWQVALASSPAPADDEAAQVERVARAMHAADHKRGWIAEENWDDISEQQREDYLILARAALAALRGKQT